MGCDRDLSFLRPQAEGLNDPFGRPVDGMPAGRPPSSFHSPWSTSWAIRTPRRAPGIGSAVAGGTKSGSPSGSARSAAAIRPRRTAAAASPASKSTAPRIARATAGPGPRVGPTAARTRFESGRPPAPPAGGAGIRTARRGCAAGAADALRSRAAPFASPAGFRGARRNGRFTPPGEPPGAARDAAARRRTGDRAARLAPFSKPSVWIMVEGTNPPGGGTGAGRRRDAVRTAESPARERLGAISVPGGLTSGPIISGGGRSILRASPWCCSKPASRWPRSTTRWRSRRFLLSRSCRATGSR